MESTNQDDACADLPQGQTSTGTETPPLGSQDAPAMTSSPTADSRLLRLSKLEKGPGGGHRDPERCTPAHPGV